MNTVLHLLVFHAIYAAVITLINYRDLKNDRFILKVCKDKKLTDKEKIEKIKRVIIKANDNKLEKPNLGELYLRKATGKQLLFNYCLSVFVGFVFILFGAKVVTTLFI